MVAKYVMFIHAVLTVEVSWSTYLFFFRLLLVLQLIIFKKCVNLIYNSLRIKLRLSRLLICLF